MTDRKDAVWRVCRGTDRQRGSGERSAAALMVRLDRHLGTGELNGLARRRVVRGDTAVDFASCFPLMLLCAVSGRDSVWSSMRRAAVLVPTFRTFQMSKQERGKGNDEAAWLMGSSPTRVMHHCQACRSRCGCRAAPKVGDGLLHDYPSFLHAASIVVSFGRNRLISSSSLGRRASQGPQTCICISIARRGRRDRASRRTYRA